MNKGGIFEYPPVAQREREWTKTREEHSSDASNRASTAHTDPEALTQSRVDPAGRRHPEEARGNPEEAPVKLEMTQHLGTMGKGGGLTSKLHFPRSHSSHEYNLHCRKKQK